MSLWTLQTLPVNVINNSRLRSKWAGQFFNCEWPQSAQDSELPYAAIAELACALKQRFEDEVQARD